MKEEGEGKEKDAALLLNYIIKVGGLQWWPCGCSAAVLSTVLQLTAVAGALG